MKRLLRKNPGRGVAYARSQAACNRVSLSPIRRNYFQSGHAVSSIYRVLSVNWMWWSSLVHLHGAKDRAVEQMSGVSFESSKSYLAESHGRGIAGKPMNAFELMGFHFGGH